MKLHEWNRFDPEDDPDRDPEWTFDDLMIEHLGNHFGSMTCTESGENECLQLALDLSEHQVAASMGITVKEMRKREEAVMMKVWFAE